MQALDGKVERDRAGKEVRYPVILTAKEKLIARAVCLAFKVSNVATHILTYVCTCLMVRWKQPLAFKVHNVATRVLVAK